MKDNGMLHISNGKSLFWVGILQAIEDEFLDPYQFFHSKPRTTTYPVIPFETATASDIKDAVLVSAYSAREALRIALREYPQEVIMEEFYKKGD